MVTTNDIALKNADYNKMKYSIILFVFILILNIWLYFYNSYLTKQITQSSESLAKVEQNIKEINSDDKVKLYTLVKANKETLKKFSLMSNIPEYINTLKSLWQTYQISFENFSYNESVLQTTVIAIDDGVSLWYQKTQKFISNFRNNETRNKELFSLWFVDAFDGQSQMKYNVKFKIK